MGEDEKGNASSSSRPGMWTAFSLPSWFSETPSRANIVAFSCRRHLLHRLHEKRLKPHSREVNGGHLKCTNLHGVRCCTRDRRHSFRHGYFESVDVVLRVLDDEPTDNRFDLRRSSGCKWSINVLVIVFLAKCEGYACKLTSVKSSFCISLESKLSMQGLSWMLSLK